MQGLESKFRQTNWPTNSGIYDALIKQHVPRHKHGVHVFDPRAFSWRVHTAARAGSPISATRQLRSSVCRRSARRSRPCCRPQLRSASAPRPGTSAASTCRSRTGASRLRPTRCLRQHAGHDGHSERVRAQVDGNPHASLRCWAAAQRQLPVGGSASASCARQLIRVTRWFAHPCNHSLSEAGESHDRGQQD